MNADSSPSLSTVNNSESNTSEVLNDETRPRSVPSADEIEALAKIDIEADRAWRLYAECMSVTDVAKKLKMSRGKAWQLIADRTADLREIQSPEHRAACVGVLLERYSDIAARARDGAEAIGPESKGYAALLAVELKACQLLGEMHNIGAQMQSSTLGDLNRLEEVSKRLAVFGLHSRAKECAAALKLADVKEVPAAAD